MIPEAVLLMALSLGAKYQIDPNLILAVIKVESNFKVTAKGKSHGEVGLMQLHPRYFKTKYDVKHNMETGVRYLAQVKKQCEPRYGRAWVVCYNTGTTKKLKNPGGARYYKKVSLAYEEIKGQNRGRFIPSASLVCSAEIPR